MTNEINLFSDTQTRPTPAMRAAIAEAVVGDEQGFLDPTTTALEERVAALLGKEAAVFLPSGTMCNQIAMAVHVRPGDEIICDRTAHIIIAEAGGAAALAGGMIHALDGVNGQFTTAQATSAIRPPSRYLPRTAMINIENTANFGGGTCWPLENLAEIKALAGKHGVALHMDGARMVNAAVAMGVELKEIAQHADTLWIDLSKGLGCPIGAVLAGPRDFIDQAWRWKQRIGGAMRQSGMMAAAGLYALDHNYDRLAEDHANAARLADAIGEIEGLTIDRARVQTNIVLFDVDAPGVSAADVSTQLARHGVRIGAHGDTLMRAVTHLDVDQAGIDRAVAALQQVMTAVADRPAA